MTEGELITAIGVALYGEHWRGDMARVRGLRRHTVDEWSRGQGTPIPPSLWNEMIADIMARRAELDVLLAEADRRAARG